MELWLSDAKGEFDLGSTGTKQILDRLRSLANKMRSGERQSLRDLRALVVDADLALLSEEIEPRILAVLYLLKRLTKDIWVNFATDASFNFPEIDCLYVKNLGSFIYSSLKETEEDDAKTLRFLVDVIRIYYKCIAELNAQSGAVYKGQ